MRYTKIFKYLFIILVTCLSACSSSNNESSGIITATLNPLNVTESRTPESVAQEDIAEASQTESSSGLIIPSVSATPPSIPLTTQPSSTSTKSGCPDLVSSEMLPIWSGGSILFAVEGSGLWAISATSLEPKSVLTFPANSPVSIIVSDDMTQLLLLFEKINSHNEPEQEIIIYDLGGEEELFRFTQTGSWRPIWEWLSDGQIKFLEQIEQTSGGEKRVLTLFDPQTNESVEIVEEIDLPGYIVNETVLFDGLASVDPTGQFVLYNSLDPQGSEVILRDLQESQVLWRHPGSIEGFSFPKPPWPTAAPQWTRDGSRVLFAAFVQQEDGGEFRVYSLMIDETLESILLDPFPDIDWRYWTLRYLNSSSNDRYLHYSLGQTTGTVDEPPDQTKGLGYIFDTQTLELREICYPSTSSSFLDGMWMSESQLLYRVRHEDGSTSLLILDVPTWTTQELVRLDPDNTLTTIGWTPVESFKN